MSGATTRSTTLPAAIKPMLAQLTRESFDSPDHIFELKSDGTNDLGLPEERAAVSEQELAMVVALIDQFTGDFEPEQYSDGYGRPWSRSSRRSLARANPCDRHGRCPEG